MQQANDIFTEIIDITLYKYNSIDLKLWGIISRDTNSRSMTSFSFLVSKDRMEQYLNKKFSNEVNRFRTVSDINIHKEATSIYFI